MLLSACLSCWIHALFILRWQGLNQSIKTRCVTALNVYIWQQHSNPAWQECVLAKITKYLSFLLVMPKSILVAGKQKVWTNGHRSWTQTCWGRRSFWAGGLCGLSERPCRTNQSLASRPQRISCCWSPTGSGEIFLQTATMSGRGAGVLAFWHYYSIKTLSSQGSKSTGYLWSQDAFFLSPKWLLGYCMLTGQNVLSDVLWLAFLAADSAGGLWGGSWLQ